MTAAAALSDPDSRQPRRPPIIGRSRANVLVVPPAADLFIGGLSTD
jgi:hypothetical protein